MRTISFITANYVARVLNYNGDENWMTHDQATIAAMNAEHFRAVAKDIADAGFEAADIWTAHCNWRAHGLDFVEQVKGICSQYDLAIPSYVGGLVLDMPTRQSIEPQFRFMKQLGAQIWAGGMWGADPAQMTPVVDEVCEQYNVYWGLENHPEKTAEEMLAKIGGGKYKRVGIALDTGWCGTQGLDALEAVKKVRDKLLILHLKDVESVGRHDTCALGEGIVPVEKVARYLVDTNWSGVIGIEHEPYDRDPMPEIKRSLERAKQWLR